LFLPKYDGDKPHRRSRGEGGREQGESAPNFGERQTGAESKLCPSLPPAPR